MGGKWVPGVSLIGLVGLMCLPTPGVAGVAIGGGCLVVVAVWAVTYAIGFVLALLAAPFGPLIRSARTSRRRRREVHAGSGIARRIGRAQPDAPAPAGEANDAAFARDARPIAIRRAPRRARDRQDANAVRKMRTSGA